MKLQVFQVTSVVEGFYGTPDVAGTETTQNSAITKFLVSRTFDALDQNVIEVPIYIHRNIGSHICVLSNECRLA